MSKLQEKKANAVFYCDYRNGSFRDEITGGTPTTSSSVNWKNTKYGKGVHIPRTTNTNLGVVYDALSAAYPDKTIIVFFENIDSNDGFREFFSTTSTGDTFILLMDDNEFGVWSYGGSTGFKGSGYSVKPGDFYVFAARYQSGVEDGTDLFVDGVYQDSVTTEVQGSTPGEFGIKTNDANFAGGGTVLFAAIFDELLSDEEISEISVELKQQRGAGDPKTRNYKWLNNPINNEFSQDSHWTKGTGWTIANSKATSDGSQSEESDLEQDNLLTIGSTYSLEYKVSGRSAGTIKIVAGTTEGTARNADGVYTEVLKCESIAFSGLSQTSRNWRGMTTLGDDVYASTWDGDIYKQTGGTGDFVALGQTSRRWYGMTTLGSDVYACVYGGDIYKQTGGTGNFVALGQTSRNWSGMTIDGSDVYACVYGGDIYKQTGGTGNFVALGQTSRNWAGMTIDGSDVYASVYNGDIYKQTGGAGDFVALGQTSRNWVFMTTLGDDVYANVYNGDIYKQTGGTGDFVALGQTSRQWYGITTLGSDVYACVSGGDIYRQTITVQEQTKIVLRADADFVGSVEYIKAHKGNKILYNAQPEYWLPTFANVTDGYLSNTDFKVDSGTWKVSQDSDYKKWIENTSGTGITYTKIKQMFGTWVWRARKSTADTVRIWFFCEDNNLTTSAGYYYYDAPSGGGARILQQPGGSQICPASKHMDNQISYTFAFTRDFDGAIALYRKEEGGNWENLGSDTHTASITANYMGFHSTGNVKHAFLGIHQGILTINELSQLYK